MIITGICTECGQPCEAYEAEIGIGVHDYMGKAGNDRRTGVFSCCCDAEIREEGE